MKTSAIFFVVGLFFILFAAYDSFFIVKETQVAIVTQFGRPVGSSILKPGLNFKLPYVQKVNYFEKRYIQWDGDPNEIPTSDKTFIWVDASARWVIRDPLLFMQRLGSEARANLVLNNLINGALRDLVTKNKLIEILLSSDWKEEYLQTTEKARLQESRNIKVGRDQFSNLIVENTKEEMAKNGIEVTSVLVKRLNYTEKVLERVYERMISERKRIAAELRSEGEGLKSEIIGRMNKDLNEIQSEAMKKAEIIKGKADAKAIAINGAAFQQDPEFYRFWVTLRSYKTILGANTSLVIGLDSDLYRYLNSAKTPVP